MCRIGLLAAACGVCAALAASDASDQPRGSTGPGGSSRFVTPESWHAARFFDVPRTSTGYSVANVVPASGNTIKGRVVYDGTPPEMPVLKGIDASGDKAQCHAGDNEDPHRHRQQTWIVGKDKGVANVLVMLEPPAGKFFAMDKAEADNFKDQMVAAIDQPYCAFEPHVVAVFAGYKDKNGKLVRDIGAKLTIKNTGVISHNVKSPGDGKVNSFNLVANPKQMREISIEFSSRRFLDIACDKHNWMSAKLVTLDHPYFAVTDKDGHFEFGGVPIGADLTIKTWHEDAVPVTKRVNLRKGVNDVKDLKIKAQL